MAGPPLVPDHGFDRAPQSTVVFDHGHRTAVVSTVPEQDPGVRVQRFGPRDTAVGGTTDERATVTAFRAHHVQREVDEFSSLHIYPSEASRRIQSYVK